MKKLIFTVCLTLISVIASAQNGGVKGFVYNSSNGDPIMFANIIVENSTLGTSTDIN